VENVQQAFDAMKASGFQLIDKAPRKGSRGTTVFFVHPKSRRDTPFGFLIEIVEDSESK
jgi:methylmalonyl-CoA/ethylmalonyl-CoA epimerase